MPSTVFSPLSRGYGNWNGELHLTENAKGPGPSLPSLLPDHDDHCCRHSGVTITPRAKSAVSAFSSKSNTDDIVSGRQSAWSEKPERELVIPKTYLTRKGAIVLFAAPKDEKNIELSKRDKLYLKKAKQKMLKHRYADYSSKIGSIPRLTQSVLAFGDEDYEKETTSITDSNNKVFLKFKRFEQQWNDVLDKHSQPGYNVDMYLNDLMSRSGTRPSTAAPTVDFRVPTDYPMRPDSTSSSIDSPDLISMDSEYLVKYLTSPATTHTTEGSAGGRSSPGRRRMSADRLAASLKSGGFLGRQTILEELDSMSEVSSRPITPANTLSRPQSMTKLKASRPSSRETFLRKYSIYEDSEDGSRENTLVLADGREVEPQLTNDVVNLKSNSRLSQRTASVASIRQKMDASLHSESPSRPPSRSDLIMLADESEHLIEQDLADQEIQAIEGIVEAEEKTDRIKIPSRSKSVQSRKKSRSSSVLSGAQQQQLLDMGTPDVSEVPADGVQTYQDIDELYFSEDAVEQEDDDEDAEAITQPLMPSYNPVMDLSILSGGSGAGTFSFEATLAENIPADQVLMAGPSVTPIQQQLSAAVSLKSDSAVSSVTHESRPVSRPLSLAEKSVASVELQESTELPEPAERPCSAASSHSGVTPVEADVTLHKSVDIDKDAENIDEAISEPINSSVEVKALPEYLNEQGEQIIGTESIQVTPVPKAPSSVASTSASQEVPAGVTEVHITPRSSAVSSKRTDPTVDSTVVADVIPPASGAAVQPQAESLSFDNKKTVSPTEKQSASVTPASVAAKVDTAKVTLPTEVAAVPPAQIKTIESEKSKQINDVKAPAVAQPETQAKSKDEETAAPKEQSEKAPATKPPFEKKKTPPPATHMTQVKKEPPKEKVPPPQKPDKKDQKPKENGKESKKSPEKKTLTKKESETKKEPPKKEIVKAMDITNYDKPTEQDFSKELPPIPPPKVKPENLVSDTKAEIARLLGSPSKAAPVKKESAREKKERLKRDIGPRVVPKKPKQPEQPEKTKEEKELDALEQKVLEAMGDTVSAMPLDDEDGGLTAEEMEIERQLMQQKMEEAEAKLKGKTLDKKDKKGTPRTGRKGKKNAEDEIDLAKKREELKEAKRLEKQRRLEEAKKVEEELKAKEEEKRRALENAKARTKYISDDVQEMKRQAEEAERAEEEARLALQEARVQAREERERRRKEEQDRRKNEAIKKREEERRRAEAGRLREQEMLMKLATKEERLRLAEEARRRKEELEEKAMVEEEEFEFHFMEEERLLKRQQEEEEAKIAELEKQSEEEAMARLVREREETSRKKRQMEEMQRQLAEEEALKRKEYEAEQARIEENQRKKEEEERLRREAEKERLRELQRIEDEARERMKQEMQSRREALMRRRDQNLERKSHLGNLKAKQGITKGWVFSYYVHWPRETYERRMGPPEDKKKRAKSAPSKSRPTQT